jgi:hypothetical protein
MLSVVPLESLDGVSYVASHDGTIGAVGATRWNDFACQNGGSELLDKFIIGRISSNLCQVQMSNHTFDGSCLNYRSGVALLSSCPCVVTAPTNCPRLRREDARRLHPPR